MSVIDLADSSDTVYKLPRSHWHCQLSTFEWEAVRPAKLRNTVEAFLTAVMSGRNAHLVLTGPPGLGKTHLGVGIYRWMVQQVGTILATWVNVPAFCDNVKLSYTPSDPTDPLLDYADAKRLVVLDDLFGRDLTAHERDQIFVRLLDIAYQNGASVVATMNQDIKELHTRIPRHEVSRLLAHAAIVPLKGQDWRLRRQ